MVKLSEEVAEALKAAKGEPLCVDVAGLDGRFVIVEQATYDAAMVALELQKNQELIREGIASMEAGRTRPVDESMEEIHGRLVRRQASEAFR